MLEIHCHGSRVRVPTGTWLGRQRHYEKKNEEAPSERSLRLFARIIDKTHVMGTQDDTLIGSPGPAGCQIWVDHLIIWLILIGFMILNLL